MIRVGLSGHPGDEEVWFSYGKRKGHDDSQGVAEVSRRAGV